VTHKLGRDACRCLTRSCYRDPGGCGIYRTSTSVTAVSAAVECKDAIPRERPTPWVPPRLNWDPMARAAVVELNKHGGLSHGKVTRCLASLFGIPLSSSFADFCRWA
jgi:hypothetical protein